MKVHDFQRTCKITPHIQKYLEKEHFGCPDALRYQFTDKCHLKISHLCCTELKKKPVREWENKTNRHIGITGMRAEEGGIRTQLGCIMTKKGKIHRFNPLIKVTDEWEDWFVIDNGIQLCELYYPPYNFKRTGCKGCPFNLMLQTDLTTMDACGLNNERRQAEVIWKPVYEEYRRIGYRLKREEQTKLF